MTHPNHLPLATIEQKQNRLAKVRVEMKGRELPAFYVVNLDNVRYLTGFTGSTGTVLITESEAAFLTDSRYTTQASVECDGFSVESFGAFAFKEMAKWLADREIARLGFEAAHTTVRQLSAMHEAMGEGVALIETDDVVESIRLVKDEGEIERIRTACRLTDTAFRFILPSLKPETTEREIMLGLENFIRRQKHCEPSFETIIVSGPRSAMPHGKASDRALQEGDLVTLDFGVQYGGYCADITRTICIGEPTKEQKTIHSIVAEAQKRAIESVREGAISKEVDAAARDYINESGHKEHFGHSVGHSLGLNVHDGPGASPQGENLFKAGMIITIEPGIYIPDWGGVRIEDDVLVTSDGCEVLTLSDRGITPNAD